jgi:hypothetical protein
MGQLAVVQLQYCKILEGILYTKCGVDVSKVIWFSYVLGEDVHVSFMEKRTKLRLSQSIASVGLYPRTKNNSYKIKYILNFLLDD